MSTKETVSRQWYFRLDGDMKKKKVGAEVVSDVKKSTNIYRRPTETSKRRFPARGNKSIFEHYSITIKPKLFRSSSLSDLNTNNSDFNIDLFKHTNCLIEGPDIQNSFDGSSGDANSVYCKSKRYNNRYMAKNIKTKATRTKCEMSPEPYVSKIDNEYIGNFLRETGEANISSVDNSSICSTDDMSVPKGATFPFKPTPSGNLKVLSNQVVFQSSTVGVLLADPTQAQVKVKFEGKAAGEPSEDSSQNFDNGIDSDPALQYGPKEGRNFQVHSTLVDRNAKQQTNAKNDKGKDLSSLGYAAAEPIDWMRVQLPKKQDLFKEFYRRIHNYINTDTIIHIGNELFDCHRIVLQIYSVFFERNPAREIELPVSNVTPEAFQTVYEWMIFSGIESNKLLKRENVLDLFCAAQYLTIKGKLSEEEVVGRQRKLNIEFKYMTFADLEDQCWSFIVNEHLFTEDTAFALFREARSKGMAPVMDLMVPRVMRFFLPLVASKDFLNLEPEEVMTFLNSNYISVTSEIEVLMAGVRWLHGDWANRKRCSVDVMRCVRFGLISPWQLVDIKRNPDNAEILEIVNEPEVQQMVDDGLAYVIIKYWYGNNSKNYYHWIDVLGLTEPAERNWIGEEKNHVTYKDFLEYLEQFATPKDQMYQQMAMMQPPRRSDDIPGSLRGMDSEKMEVRRPKMDFPLPSTLKGLTGDKDKSFPTMSEFFDTRRKIDNSPPSPTNRSPTIDMNMSTSARLERRNPETDRRQNVFQRQRKMQSEEIQEQNSQYMLLRDRNSRTEEVRMCSVKRDNMASSQYQQIFDPPEKDSDINTTNSDTSSGAGRKNTNANKSRGKRHSIAASYLAAATAALSSSRRLSQNPASPTRPSIINTSRAEVQSRTIAAPMSLDTGNSPQISIFNHSKESLARMNMNKLSASILGPSNKNYISEGSLFNWDRETVLVFGGVDPHTPFDVGRNTGKDIYRFDPVTNVWDHVGDLPEPRHHHSVAFLRGRVYLVGGADPRDDDIRGKSVVVSTVWSFEPVTRSWYSESGLSIPRKNFGLVAHKMALYAIGGQDKKGRVLRSVERFDPKSGSWSEVRSMGVSRMAVACSKYRDYIWVAGGMTGEKKRPVCKIVECYNSKTNEWTEIHSLRFPRCFATLFAINDRLYIVGGAGKMSEKEKTASSVGAIDVWDWKDREWKQETEMSMPRHGHALAYLGTQLIVIGGVTTIYMRALNNVESFCCERRAWIRGVATLPSPLSGHGAVTLPPASLM